MATSSIECGQCGYDLTKLEMTLPHRHPQREAPSAGGVTVSCPVCSTPSTDLMKGRGFFLREQRNADGVVESAQWRYWVLDSSTPMRAPGQGPRPVEIGSLKIQFEKDAEPIRLEDVVYKTVPQFVATRGGDTTEWCPTLPVRPAFVDCLDETALRKIRAGVAGAPLRRIVHPPGGTRTLEFVIPLRELPESAWPRKEWELNGPIEGVFLRHWPNLDDLRWKYHLVSLGFEGPKAASAMTRRWSVQALVPSVKTQDGRWSEDEDDLTLFPLPGPDIAEPDRTIFTVAIEGRAGRHHGRPAWVSVDLGDCGGVFALKPGTTDLGTLDFSFGLDFGTSNTVIAWKDPSSDVVQTVAPDEGTTRWLVGHLEGPQDPDDLWPGARWAGARGDLLPSELLLRRKTWPDYNSVPGDVTALRFGQDIGVPLTAAQRTASQAPFRRQSLLTDFKWERALPAQGLDNMARETFRLQAKFLECAHLMALATVIRKTSRYPSALAVKYSYPPAFGPDDKKHLEIAGEGSERFSASVASRVTELVGLTQPATFRRGADEASAAVFDIDTNREFTAFVDIGGGSLEITVRDEFTQKQEGHEGLDHIVASKSLYFGGGVYLHALADHPERRCVRRDVDYTQLSARVRRYATGRAFIKSSGLIEADRADTARLRGRVYGDAIADYVARTLAGLCLEHGYQKGSEGQPEASRRLNLSRNRLFYYNPGAKTWRLGHGSGNDRSVQFTIFLLGNGWNAIDVAVPDGTPQTVEEYFAQRVEERLQQLLHAEQATARRIRDATISLESLRIVIECPALPETLHRKAVVATNLLRAAVAGVEAPAPTNSGVLGLELVVNDRKIEWYRPIGEAANPKLKGESPKRLRQHDRDRDHDHDHDHEDRKGGSGRQQPDPSHRWSVGLEKTKLGGGMDFASALAAIQKSEAPWKCKVWRKGYDAWKPVAEVPEFAEELEPKLGDDESEPPL